MNTSGFVSKFIDKVQSVIQDNQLISPGDGVVVGVSGGPDSVCLLHVLNSLRESLQMKLYAVHVNHMLRGSEADADEKYAVDLCHSLGISIQAVKINIAKAAADSGISLEEAGREARYDEFRKYAAAVGASKIAVAHNRNDQAETVFMNIIRGTGTAGLSGMEYRRDDIVRPILWAGRAEIERYCREAGLSPRTDSTNLEQEFTRNKVRLDLFPYISEKTGIDIVESLYRLSQNAAVDESFMDRCAIEAFDRAVAQRKDGLVVLDIAKLKDMDPAIRIRVFRISLNYVSGNVKGIGSIHYKALSELVSKSITGSAAELPKGVRAVVSYDSLKICSSDTIKLMDTDHEEFCEPVLIPGITLVPALDSNISASVIVPENIDKYIVVGYNPYVQYFDYDKVHQGIYIRNRRIGDVFKPFGSNGTKKLKEYFIDSKIPRHERGMIPLVTMGKDVLWIVGYKISDKFKVTENTKSVLKIEYKRRICNES